MIDHAVWAVVYIVVVLAALFAIAFFGGRAISRWRRRRNTTINGGNQHSPSPR